ncbi:MAG TPA: hypothetical protein VK760_11445 [Candidatus Acidoferrales bacterium]|jgi:hypothetical protein|nr:hypothetical protein [Candidatus Acidoferrales bacterium]
MNKHFVLAIAASAALGLCLGPAAAVAADTQSAIASGPTYTGAPDVNVTAAFYAAGGGPGGFSMVRAMKHLIGEDQLQSELQQLASEYGQANADLFPHLFDYAVNDAWVRAGKDNVMIPPFGSHEGRALANDLIRDGTAPDGTFRTGYFLDHTLSAKVRAQVIADMVSRYGVEQTTTFDRMSNQFFFDMSQTLGGNTVSLAPNH